jgi:Flp pilus assembly protein TadD
MKQVSRELGVRYVVEGSVRKFGDRVRISAQLIDATTGHHLWAERYDRELQDVFALQDQITAAIVASMHPELERSEMERVMRQTPKKVDAWDCLMRAWWHLWQWTKDGNAKARALLQRAIELDENSSEAFLTLAISHLDAAWFQWTDSPAQAIAELSRAARRSVELDSKNAAARHVLCIAHVVTGRFDEAIAAGQRAIELNPSLSEAYASLALALTLAGRPDQSLATVETGMRLSPQDPRMFIAHFVAGFACFAAERYEDAVEHAKRSARDNPKVPPAWRLLAASCAQLGRMGEARDAVREVVRLSPDSSIAGMQLAFSFPTTDVWHRYYDALRKAGLKE